MLTCPQCHTETKLGKGGISSLLSDFGVTGLADSAMAGAIDFQASVYKHFIFNILPE